MIVKLIGVRRVAILAVLGAVNLVVAAVFFLWVMPMHADAENQMNGITGEISTLQGNIQNVKQELMTFKENLPKYEALKTRGFFLEQDRFKIGRDLGELRNKAELLGFSYVINDIENIQNVDAATAGARLINSRIQLTGISMLLDIEFYRFLDLLQAQFPAHIRLHSFELKRAATLNEAVLQEIARNKPPNIVTAEAKFDWLTLVPLPPPAGMPPGMPGAGGF